MENRQDNFIPPFTQNQQPKAKRPIALIIAVVVLALLALGLGVASYLQAARASDLQRQVDDLKSGNAHGDQTAAEFREIPEVGLKYKLTDKTKSLTYVYGTNATGDKEQIGFTTTALLRIQNSKGEYPCGSMPVGAIALYKNEKDVPADRSGSSSTVKKVGDYHAKYNPSDEGCIVDGETAPGTQEGFDALKAVYDSLEVK